MSVLPRFSPMIFKGLEDKAMFTRTSRLSAAFLLVLVSEAWADSSAPTAEESALIQAHASSWNLLLERQHLKAMTLQWETLFAKPDSAAVLYQQATGRGQHIDVSIHAALNVTTEEATFRWLVAGQTVQRQTGRHASPQPTMPSMAPDVLGRSWLTFPGTFF